MKLIRKKCWPEYFEKVKSGDKKFEVRLADSDYEIGDILILEEWNPETKKYTDRHLSKKITDLINTKDLEFYQQSDIDKHGYCIMSLDKTDKENDEWFANLHWCFSCGSENLEKEIRGKREVLVCSDCGIPNAGQPVGA